jgi:hypothetical protein
MSTRPWMKFYPSDWLGSSRLRRCTFAARGLAIELICHMHQGEPYGHLTVVGNAAIARLVGMSSKKLSQTLPELIQNGIILESKTGVLFSPRMVRDYEKSLKRQADGGLGGNPALKQVVNPEDKPSDTRCQIPEARKKDIDIEAGKRKSRKAKTIPLPKGWRPNANAITLANSLNVDLAEVEARFRDYLASSGKEYADYDAALRTFIRNTPKFNGLKNVSTGPRQLQDDKLSVSKAIDGMQEQVRAGTIEFAPRPRLSIEGEGNRRLLSKG